MKRRPIAIFLIMVIAIAIGISVKAAKNRKETTASVVPQQTTQQEIPGTIDGAKNPELIPDRIAYTILFRLIANRPTEEEKGRIRSFIRQMGIGKPCCRQDPSLDTKEDDIDALIALAEEFHRRVSILDAKAKEIKKSEPSGLSASLKNQLKQLQKQKENIVDEIVAALPTRLSASGVEKLRKQVKEKMKSEMKYKPSSDPQ